jgi:hypothetical protein
MDSSTIIFVFAGIIIIAGLLLALISLTKKGVKHLDVDKYRVRYLAIEQQLKKDEQSSYHMCILNADKLLDHALTERGLKGKTMGERMVNAKTMFSNNNEVWTAHKLRNRIAHEQDVKITYDETRYALAYFKKALKDLGAI